jgi:hypothetical protein
MGFEKYTPTQEDMDKAEGIMTERQRVLSKKWEANKEKLESMGMKGSLERNDYEDGGYDIRGEINGHHVFVLAYDNGKISGLVDKKSIDNEKLKAILKILVPVFLPPGLKEEKQATVREIKDYEEDQRQKTLKEILGI